MSSEQKIQKTPSVLFPAQEDFRAAYELALLIGEQRFGSPCVHKQVKNGRCTHCLRKVESRA